MCVCVCVRERERERESVCVCVCVLISLHMTVDERLGLRMMQERGLKVLCVGDVDQTLHQR
jgi:hypothetical protein